MNREDAVQVLREAEHTVTQGRYKLRDKDGCMCVMGVLCNTIDPDGWRGNDWKGADKVPSPRDLPDWLNEYTESLDPAIDEWSVVWNLIYMNDNKLTFGEIADWLEGKLTNEAVEQLTEERRHAK